MLNTRHKTFSGKKPAQVDTMHKGVAGLRAGYCIRVAMAPTSEPPHSLEALLV